jgi:hypothetical protein
MNKLTLFFNKYFETKKLEKKLEVNIDRGSNEEVK